VLLLLPQLYVPRVPGVPDYDDSLVPDKWGFQGEVRGGGVRGWGTVNRLCPACMPMCVDKLS
jgi:hypothetical protein